jgi:phospholipase/carboxylesterase
VASPLLPCVEVDPPGGPSGTVLWLHGLGADGHDFEPLVPLLGLPRVRFVFPHAPRRPVTINGGLEMRAWYDLRSLGTSPDRHSAEDIRASAAQIEALLAREAERGVPPERTVLAGFSQGGAMTYFVGDRYRQALCGLMVLSAGEVLPDTREAEASPANRLTPLLVCHGTEDRLVDVARGRAAYHAHAASGRPAEWHEFEMAHEVSREEIDVLRRWLGERLGPR